MDVAAVVVALEDQPRDQYDICRDVRGGSGLVSRGSDSARSALKMARLARLTEQQR